MSEYVKIELTEEALQRIIDHCKVAENKVDDVQEGLDSKMDKSNPMGTGSFSMNRAEGSSVGLNSHAEGTYNIASGAYSHAEGGQTKAVGAGSHSEGNYTVAHAKNSHAEGWDTKAYGENSHAEGTQTYALGKASHAGGIHTEANYDYQTVVGRFNDNKSNTLFEVGNGTDAENLNNALEVRQNGDVYIDGDFYNGDGEKVESFDKAFFVNFTASHSGSGYTYGCSKTYSVIKEHFDAHDLIVAHYYDVLDEYEMTTALVGVDAGENKLNFRFFVNHYGSDILYQDVSIDSTNTITSSGLKQSKEIPHVSSSDEGKVLSVNSSGDYYVKEMEGLPQVSASDNGKVLTVANGVWDKQTIPSSGGAVTLGGSYSLSYGQSVSIKNVITSDVAFVVTYMRGYNSAQGLFMLIGAKTISSGSSVKAIIDTSNINISYTTSGTTDVTVSNASTTPSMPPILVKVYNVATS